MTSRNATFASAFAFYGFIAGAGGSEDKECTTDFQTTKSTVESH
jgi:hypothetical protein